MAKTSIHVRPVLPSSEEHNQRLKPLDYVKQELTQENTSLVKASVADTLKDVKTRYTQSTGQKMQKKATPIREAVVVLDKKTNLKDLEKLSDKFQERFGMKTFQIHIHEDEGHTNKDGDFIKNRHAHMVIDWTDQKTGKSLKLSKEDMAEMQTLTAETLGMERGQSSDRKHLTAIQFKNEAQKEEYKEVQKSTKAAKLDLLGTKAAITAANTGEKLKNGLFEGIKRITGSDKATAAVEEAQKEVEELRKQLAAEKALSQRYADKVKEQGIAINGYRASHEKLIKENNSLTIRLNKSESQSKNRGLSI
jgi:hypothetical protein